MTTTYTTTVLVTWEGGPDEEALGIGHDIRGTIRRDFDGWLKEKNADLAVHAHVRPTVQLRPDEEVVTLLARRERCLQAITMKLAAYGDGILSAGETVMQIEDELRKVLDATN